MAEPSRLTQAQERNFIDFVHETISQYLQTGDYSETLVDEVAQAIFKAKIFSCSPDYEEVSLRVLDSYVWNVVEKMGKNGNWRSLFLRPDCTNEKKIERHYELATVIAQALKKEIFFDLGFSFNLKTLEQLSGKALSRYILRHTVKSSPLNGIWKERVFSAVKLYNDLKTHVEESVQRFCLATNFSKKKIDLICSDLEGMGICVDEQIEAMILDYYLAMMVRDYLTKGSQSRLRSLKEHIELKIIHDFSWIFPPDQIEWLLKWVIRREEGGQTVSENSMDYSALSYWIEQAKKPGTKLS